MQDQPREATPPSLRAMRGFASPTNRDQTFGAAYAVSLPAFQGPLQLLLHLIEREELDISEISLVTVTDQYLHTLEQLEELEPGALADFLVVASRLLYIKSNRLLPRPQAEEDEDEDGGDALIRHLLEYRQFKQAANSLKARADEGYRVFVRPPAAPPSPLQSTRTPDLSNVDMPGLQAALKRALERIPVEAPASRVQAYAVTVAEQIEIVRKHVRRMIAGLQGDERATIAFSELLGASYSRIEAIVTFLAVLELIKLQELRVEQEGTFGEILLLPVDPAPTPSADPR